jgi:predicted nucleotidyltransferase
VLDHLEMARRFAAAQIAKRTDVIGVLVFGSVARGEATETSDIDLAIYVKEDTGEGKRDLACWETSLESAFRRADSGLTCHPVSPLRLSGPDRPLLSSCKFVYWKIYFLYANLCTKTPITTD